MRLRSVFRTQLGLMPVASAVRNPLSIGVLLAVVFLPHSRSGKWSPPTDLRAGFVVSDTIAGTVWTREDWRIFEAKVRWGARQRLDTLPIGLAIARLAETFVGTQYTPATLEVPGPERLVVNLRELDCVTLVENVIALARFIRGDGTVALANPSRARERYESYLRRMRYRGGVIDGYPSRLHYFSEWLADNERHGAVLRLTKELGGIVEPASISFMSSHVKVYRQLGDSGALAAIKRVEAALNADPRRSYIPKARIASLTTGIRDGDIIAATSALPGLDVAHTGIALWQNGELHLLHAPLVGKSVEISQRPLAERILAIHNQDGIMVARVLDQPPPS